MTSKHLIFINEYNAIFLIKMNYTELEINLLYNYNSAICIDNSNSTSYHWNVGDRYSHNNKDITRHKLIDDVEFFNIILDKNLDPIELKRLNI